MCWARILRGMANGLNRRAIIDIILTWFLLDNTICKEIAIILAAHQVVTSNLCIYYSHNIQCPILILHAICFLLILSRNIIMQQWCYCLAMLNSPNRNTEHMWIWAQMVTFQHQHSLTVRTFAGKGWLAAYNSWWILYCTLPTTLVFEIKYFIQ